MRTGSTLVLAVGVVAIISVLILSVVVYRTTSRRAQGLRRVRVDENDPNEIEMRGFERHGAVPAAEFIAERIVDPEPVDIRVDDEVEEPSVSTSAVSTAEA